jgi:hypothetical protein
LTAFFDALTTERAVFATLPREPDDDFDDDDFDEADFIDFDAVAPRPPPPPPPRADVFFFPPADPFAAGAERLAVDALRALDFAFAPPRPPPDERLALSERLDDLDDPPPLPRPFAEPFPDDPPFDDLLPDAPRFAACLAMRPPFGNRILTAPCPTAKVSNGCGQHNRRRPAAVETSGRAGRQV